MHLRKLQYFVNRMQNELLSYHCPSEEDIQVFITKLVSGEVSEAQLGAWLMATCIHGLNVQVNVFNKASLLMYYVLCYYV